MSTKKKHQSKDRTASQASTAKHVGSESAGSKASVANATKKFEMDSSSDSISFSLELSFTSDWHVGSGLEEPGGDDRLVCRDADSLPYVPAKTLTAMIRDSAERIATGMAMESGSNANAADISTSEIYRWVLWIFGDQPTRHERLNHEQLHRSPLSIRSAHFSKGICEKLRPLPKSPGNSVPNIHRQEQRDALCFTKPSVRIAENGHAMNKHLRFDQMARGDVTLFSQNCTLQLAGRLPEQKRFAVHLLAAAIYTTERLGAKRRRGAGRLKITVAGTSLPTPDQVADFFDGDLQLPSIFQSPKDQELPQTGTIADTASASGAFPLSNAWIRIPYRITLLTPLLIVERTTGNLTRSLDFVPGTMMLPIVARTLGTHQSVDVRSWIADGDLRVSAATIDFGDANMSWPGRPAAAALFHAKGEVEPFGRLGAVSNRFEERGREAEHPKAVRDVYIGLITNGILPKFGRPQKLVIPHNTVDEVKQRPTEAVGGVFSNEAIAAGTVLSGEILLRRGTVDDHREWSARLNGKQSLGRSRKDDYGLVDLNVFAPNDLSAASALDDQDAASPINQFTIWFTSDLILRSDELRAAPTATSIVHAIADELALSTDDMTFDDDPNVSDAFLRHRRIESWHVGWGIARPSLVCIAGGSCVRLTAAPGKAFDLSALKTLEQNGLGERRAEGYGTLLLNSPLLTESLETWTPTHGAHLSQRGPASFPNRISAPLGLDASTMLNIDRQVWRNSIRRGAIQLAGRDFLKLQSDPPTASQIGIVRSLLQTLNTFTSRNSQLITGLTHLKELRGKRWPNGTLDEILDLVQRQEAIWERLQVSWNVPGEGPTNNWPQLSRVVGGQSMVMAELWVEAVRTVIETSLKSHQRQREQLRPNARGGVNTSIATSGT